MQRVFTAAHLPEAHLVRGLLASAGINARVLNEYAPGGLGDLPVASAYPEVWVEDERDLTQARKLIASYEHDRPAAEVQRCPACGEENPRHFAVCWHCQKPL